MTHVRAVLVICGVWCVAVAAGIGARGYWYPDEPRHAEVAREMAREGTWLRPQLNGEPYPDKPPLFFWIVALTGWIGGFAPWATRIPTALASLACALGLYAFAARLYSRRCALAAALVLLTTGEFLWLAQRVDMNIWVTLLVLAAVAAGAFACHRESRTPWAAVFLLAGIGILLKGPVVPLLMFGILLPWMVLAFGWRSLRWVPWWTAPLALVGPAAWAVPLLLRGEGDYLREMVFGHAIAMAVDTESHRQPPWFYFVNWPFATLPWFLVLPWAVPALLRRAPDWYKSRRLLPLVWMGAPFVLLSFVSAKRSLYLLPAAPGLALAVGWYLTEARPSRWSCAPAAALLAVVGAATIIVEPVALPASAWGGVAIGCALAAGAALALRGSPVRGVVLALALASLAFRLGIAPHVDPYKSADHVVAALKRRSIVPEHAVGFDVSQISLGLDRTIHELPVERIREADGRWMLARVGGRGVRSEEDLAALGWHVWFRAHLGDNRIVLAGRQPADSAEEIGERRPWHKLDWRAELRSVAPIRWGAAGVLLGIVLIAALRPVRPAP